MEAHEQHDSDKVLHEDEVEEVINEEIADALEEGGAIDDILDEAGGAFVVAAPHASQPGIVFVDSTTIATAADLEPGALQAVDPTKAAFVSLMVTVTPVAEAADISVYLFPETPFDFADAKAINPIPYSGEAAAAFFVVPFVIPAGWWYCPLVDAGTADAGTVWQTALG